MLNPAEPLINASKANIEASLKLATKSLDGATRLLKHQLEVARTLMEEGAETMKAVLQEGGSLGSMAGRTAAHEKQMQKLLELSREYFELTAQTQTELTQLVQENMELMNQALKRNLEAFAGDATATGESEKSRKRA